MFEQMAAPAINGKTYPGTELSIADTPEGRKIFRLLEIIDHANSQIVADLPQQREVEELAGQLNPILHSTVIDLARTWLKQIRSAPRMP